MQDQGDYPVMVMDKLEGNNDHTGYYQGAFSVACVSGMEDTPVYQWRFSNPQ